MIYSDRVTGMLFGYSYSTASLFMAVTLNYGKWIVYTLYC